MGEQVKEALDGFVVAFDDLEGDTIGSGGDGGVRRLGNLDFERFTGREPETNMGAIQECVQGCTRIRNLNVESD